MTPLPRLSGTHLQAMIRSGGLRNGDRVAATVLRHIGGNNYVISVRGTAYPTKSSIPLTPGTVFTARLSQVDSTIFLRLETARGIPQFLSTNGLSAPADRVIATHLLALGLPLNPEVIVSLRRWHDEQSPRSPLRLRIAAVLRDKGIAPSDALVSDVETVLVGVDPDGRGSHQSDHRNRRRSSRYRPPLVTETDTADHAVQIFNHLTGKNGQWVILPVGTAEGPSGSLQLFYQTQRPSYDRAVLTIRSQPYYWGFSWTNPATSHGSNLSIHTDFDGPVPETELDAISSVLEKFRIRVDRRIQDDAFLASFAIFQLQAIMTGVDEIV